MWVYWGKSMAEVVNTRGSSLPNAHALTSTAKWQMTCGSHIKTVTCAAAPWPTAALAKCHTAGTLGNILVHVSPLLRRGRAAAVQEAGRSR